MPVKTVTNVENIQSLVGVKGPITFTLPNLTHTPPKPKLRAAAAPGGSDSDGGIDTFGWDTVYAIKLPDVNSAIAKYQQFPKSYSYTTTDNYSIQGTFDSWQMLTTGSSGAPWLDAHIPNGTLTDSGGTVYSYADVDITFQVVLEYLPATGATQPAGQQQNLMVKQISSQSDPTVTVQNVQFNGTQPPTVVRALLSYVIEEWANANLDQFVHVFSVVNINNIADNAAFQWIQPTSTLYAYGTPGTQNPDPEQCVLAVLCMTQNRTPGQTVQAVDPNVIPSGGRSGFVINGERYLAQIVSGQVPDLFVGALSTDFELVSGTTQLTNSIALTMSDINGYTPTVNAGDFTCTLTAGELQVQVSNAQVTVSPGITLYLNFTVHAAIKLETRSDGTQALIVYDAQQTESSHSIEVAPWVTITEIVASIIVGIIAAAFTDGAGQYITKAMAEAIGEPAQSVFRKIVPYIIKLLILGVLTSVGSSISDMISANAEENANNLPPFDPFVNSAASTVNWPGSTGLVIQSAQLNTSLQLGIDPVFAESLQSAKVTPVSTGAQAISGRVTAGKAMA